MIGIRARVYSVIRMKSPPIETINSWIISHIFAKPLFPLPLFSDLFTLFCLLFFTRPGIWGGGGGELRNVLFAPFNTPPIRETKRKESLLTYPAPQHVLQCGTFVQSFFLLLLLSFCKLLNQADNHRDNDFLLPIVTSHLISLINMTSRPMLSH